MGSLSENFRSFILVSIGLLLLGCEGIQPTQTPATSCEKNTAQIAVWDGRLQRICGCGGTNGAFASPGSPLSCTLTLGTTVFIYYQGPFLRHQIVPVGTPGLPASAVFDPQDEDAIRVHAFLPQATGVYQFKDQYDGNLTGDFTVTP